MSFNEIRSIFLIDSLFVNSSGLFFGSSWSNKTEVSTGNGHVYWLALDPETINSPAKFSSVLAQYPIGSLIIYFVNWNNYQSYSYWAGSSGYVLINGGSAFAIAFNRAYTAKNYRCAMHCVDAIGNYSQWENL